jgi:hypothetical protein
MQVSPKMLLIVGAVVAVVVLVLTRSNGSDVASARKETVAAIQQAKVTLLENQELKSRADSALAVAASAEKSAVVAKAEYASAKQALFKAALATPDTCGPVVLAAQKALSEADSVISVREHELAGAIVADSADRKRAEKAEKSLADFIPPATHLVAATDDQSFRARLAKLRPHLFVGVVAGVDAQQKPNAVAGIGLGWQF